MAADPLNLDCFKAPKLGHYELAARGYAVRSFGGSSPDPANLPVQNGGMSRFARDHMKPGQMYYRFCDAKAAAKDWKKAAAGGWWVEYETLKIIFDFAAQHSHIKEYATRIGHSAVGYAAKLFLAVPYEWGDCEYMVKAYLQARLDAFRGIGDVARLDRDADKRDPRDGNAKYIPINPPPGQSLYQLYIPELGAHFDQAFDVKAHGLTRHFRI